jgi:Putative restriction endonuclease
MPSNAASQPMSEPHDQMTIREFLAFTETRPDEERWELIDGVPVFKPVFGNTHRAVIGNIASHLLNHKNNAQPHWLPLLGIGIKSPTSNIDLLLPDALVQEGPVAWQQVTQDALALFEVCDDTDKLNTWHRVYSSVPNCQHYVTVSMKSPEVTAFDRAATWQARPVKGLTSSLDLAALGLSIPLADIYRYTPLGA